MKLIGRKKGALASLLIGMMILGLLLPGGGAVAAENGNNAAAVNQFSDVDSQNSNLAYINYVTAKGIMSGFPDGSFQPGAGLTRAQAAVIISKAANLNLSSQEASGFKDVARDHWAANYISAAVKAGYLKGLGDGSYQPEEPLTRAQGVSLILRLSKQADPGTVLPELNDMDPTHWAARSMAIALDSGMIDAPVNNSIQPDRPINRGDISRALGVLLTSDPDLSSRKLYSTMTVKKGTVKLAHGSGEAQLITNSAPIGAGDTVVTGKDGEAVINYPDGSSLLLKRNSTLTIKESQGRAYIKQDGQPGAAVDDLQVELKVGVMFGGLSSLAAPAATETTPTTSMKKTSGRLAAATDRYDLLAAAGETPWYRTAEKKKVKVKVDMPWGVAAIRGSFWSNTVNSDGSGSANLLEGSASVSSGGQSVDLSPGQGTESSGGGAPPSSPAPMSPQQQSEWNQQQSWVQSTFNNMSQNQGAPMGGTPAGTNTPSSPADSLSQTLNQALSQAQQAASGIPSSSSGGSSSSSGGTITVSDMLDTYYFPNMFPGSSGTPVAGHITVEFTVSPANAVITCATSGGTDVVDVSLGASSGSSRTVTFTCQSNQTGFKSGQETLTFTASLSGYTSATKTVNVWTLPPQRTVPSYVSSSYSTPLNIHVYEEGDLWSNEDIITLKFIEAGTAKPATDTSGNTLAGITASSVFPGDFWFALNSQLGIRDWEYVILINGTPRAIAPLKVLNYPPSLYSLGIEAWAFAGYSKFTDLAYSEDEEDADHYLFRAWPSQLPPPSLGETLDTSCWHPARVYDADNGDPGTPFPISAGDYVQVAAVDADGQVLACSSHQMLSYEIGQVPHDSFDTPPVLVPGMFVASTHLTAIADTVYCSEGGYFWIFQPDSFAATGNIPAWGYLSDSFEYSDYRGISSDFEPQTVLCQVQEGGYVGFIGYDGSWNIQVFQEYQLKVEDIAGTQAPELTVNFTPGSYSGTTKLTGLGDGNYRICVSDDDPEYDAAQGGYIGDFGEAYTISGGIAPDISVSQDRYIWVFKLDGSGYISAFGYGQVAFSAIKY